MLAGPEAPLGEGGRSPARFLRSVEVLQVTAPLSTGSPRPGLVQQAEIEAMRRELYRLARRRGYADPQVVELSRRLDDLIVRWHRRFGSRGRKPATRPFS